MDIPRRNFLKMTAAGAAAAFFTGCSKDSDPSSAEPTWHDGMPINPDISNMRVVCCHDTGMISALSSSFSTQNSNIDSARVGADLDEMAKQLATSAAHSSPTSGEAWQLIFRKPTGKAWGQVRAAIKVNCINTANMPRVAIIQKLVSVLSGLGVAPANTIIYDGCSSAYGSGKYSPYCSLSEPSLIPAAVSSGSDLLGGTIDVAVTGISPMVACTADIANGVADILIDVAVNKGHGSWTSGATLCLKNHFGTFAPISELHSTDALFNINKHSAIMGGDPVRQQLCIIDTLVGSQDGPGTNPTTKIDRLVMGTFAPAVDYCCIKNVREAVCGWSHEDSVVARFMTDFGYAESDPVWVDVPPAV